MCWKYGNGQQIVILAHVRVSPFFYTMFVYNQHNKLRNQIIRSSVFKILNTGRSWRVAASYYKVLSKTLQRYGERVISHLYSKHTAAAVNYSLLWLKCEPNCCSAACSPCCCVCAQVWCSGLGVLQQWLSPSLTIPVPLSWSACLSAPAQTTTGDSIMYSHSSFGCRHFTATRDCFSH